MKQVDQVHYHLSTTILCCRDFVSSSSCSWCKFMIQKSNFSPVCFLGRFSRNQTWYDEKHQVVNDPPSPLVELGVKCGVGKGAEVGACAWPPSQKLSISLMLSTKQSGITYTLEYFVRELSSSSTCPSRIMIRLRLLKVSMIRHDTHEGDNNLVKQIITGYGAHLRCR